MRAVTVRIEGSDVHADFTGTAAQVHRPVNCPINYTRAFVALPPKIRVRPDPAERPGDVRAAAPVGARGHAAQSDVSRGVLLAPFGGDAVALDPMYFTARLAALLLQPRATSPDTTACG